MRKDSNRIIGHTAGASGSVTAGSVRTNLAKTVNVFTEDDECEIS
jgi:hypothetical protein